MVGLLWHRVDVAHDPLGARGNGVRLLKKCVCVCIVFIQKNFVLSWGKKMYLRWCALKNKSLWLYNKASIITRGMEANSPPAPELPSCVLSLRACVRRALWCQELCCQQLHREASRNHGNSRTRCPVPGPGTAGQQHLGQWGSFSILKYSYTPKINDQQTMIPLPNRKVQEDQGTEGTELLKSPPFLRYIN